MGRIKQLNIGFNPLEDRLLLRVRTEDDDGAAEYRFLLTRRFVRLLLTSTEQLLSAELRSDPRVVPEGREAFRRFREDEALSGADFTTPYRDDNARTPLGGEPLLLQGLRAAAKSGGAFAIELQSTTGKSLTLNLNADLLVSLRELIAREVKRAEWDLSLHSSTDESDPVGEQKITIN